MSPVAWVREEDRRLEEALLRAQLPDGPAVCVLPRPGYGKKFAAVTVRFGSIDTHFRLPEEAEARRVPDGVAHFLEHQLFAQEEGDAFDRFAALGASANAYTSYTTTTYLFSTAENFAEALRHLLDFVQEPYFTDAGTEKERAIILQEIRMYADHPGWRVRQHLHACLYHSHPVRHDIAGTAESVGEITTEHLRLCYEAFYHPANMAVSVVGDVAPERVLELVQDSLRRHPRGPWRPPVGLLPPEPASVVRRRCEDRMAVARPILAIGFKERQVPLRGRAQLERDLATEIGLEAVFGRSSPLYRRWYEAGLIDQGFGAGYYGEETFGLSRIGGETDRPEELEAEIRAAVDRVRREGVAAEDCERQRRARLGDFVREFNSPEALGPLLAELYFAGIDLFAYREVLETLTADQVSARLASHLDPDLAATVLVRPKEAAGAV
jgi:predicted Zn-dependent peptidase